MQQKLIGLGLDTFAAIVPHLEDFEPVDVPLANRNGPLHMAVYRIQPGVGVLVWAGNNYPAGTRPNGKLYFLDREGKVQLSYCTVGHLYGWPQAECSKNDKEFFEHEYAKAKASELPEEEWHDVVNAAYRAAQAEHHKPVADAVAEACKRLGVTTLCKFDGYFVWGEIPGVTLLSDANFGQGSRAGQYMTQFGTYRWAPRDPEPVYHFVVSAKDGAG